MKNGIIFVLIAVALFGLSCSKNNTDNPINTESQEPDAIVLSASYETLPAGGQATLVNATLLDTNGDSLGSGYDIEFEITGAPDSIGAGSPSFNYISSDDSLLWVTQSPTVTTGTAQAILYSGTMAGDITIKATLMENDSIFAEQNLITITANQPDHISLTAAEPEILVGYNSTVISAALVDNFENPIEGEFSIVLDVAAAPSMQGVRSVSFVYPPNEDSLLHTVELTTDENGIARVEIFSGTKSGWITIAAALADSGGMAAEARLIRMLAGPPEGIGLAPSNSPHAENDSVYCPIACLLWDRYTNPCADTSLTINFSIIPDTIANIISPVHPDSMGFAQTFFCYTCEHTFDTVRVITWFSELVDTSQNIIIPPYGVNIDPEPYPDTIYISPGETETSEIIATLSDGLGCLIENGVLIFSATGYGRIDGQSIDTTDYRGIASVNFLIRYDDIPIDSSGCRATVRSTLRGYPETRQSCEVSCIKVQ